MTINFKGKKKVITVYQIESKSVQPQNFLLLTNANNPLVVRFNDEYALTLKEVR